MQTINPSFKTSSHVVIFYGLFEKENQGLYAGHSMFTIFFARVKTVLH
jgi:hypothetical protein